MDKSKEARFLAHPVYTLILDHRVATAFKNSSRTFRYLFRTHCCDILPRHVKMFVASYKKIFHITVTQLLRSQGFLRAYDIKVQKFQDQI